jgi:hypothetical protein
MRETSERLIKMLLGVSLAVATACTATSPTKSTESNANLGATQSNVSKNATGKKPDKTTGAIEVTSVPPGARVLLVPTDEAGAGEPQSKGLTPTTIEGLEPGKYTVDLEMPGYKFFQKEVVVKAGAATKVTATLKKH